MALRLTERLNVLRDNLGPGDNSKTTRSRAFGLYLVRLSILIIRQWIRDKPQQQAAALTYQSALSLVPLVAIAFTLIRLTSDKVVEDQLLNFMATQILPDMQDVTTHLKTFSRNISTGAFGGMGLLVMLATSWYLYDSVGRVFNDIWRTTRRRTLLSRLLTFYALVTLLPILAGTSLYFSGKLIGTNNGLQFLVPLLIQFSALFLINKLLPNTQVRWWAALAGCMVTGLLLEALKHGFITFAKRTMLENYQGIYGSIGLVPLLLVWINLSWLLILLGAEIANALQNLKLLEAEERRRTDDEPINGLSAAQVLAVIAADHTRGGHGVTREAISQRFGLTSQAVEAITRRLVARSLIAEVSGDKEGFIPGRSPSLIRLEEVLGAFRATDLQAASGTTSPALQQLVTDLESSRRTRIAGVTIAHLQPELEKKKRVEEEERPRRRTSSIMALMGLEQDKAPSAEPVEPMPGPIPDEEDA
jgi:membrane protein